MRSLVVLLAAYLILGAGYSVSTPIFEAPDELQHFAAADHIARTASLPPLGKPGENLWEQEALQAPLYYVLSGLAIAPVDTSDLPQQAVLQPKPNFGDPELPGKKNAFLHPPSQAFPYRRTALAVHLSRWLSLLLGAGTVALTYFAARMVFNSVILDTGHVTQSGDWLPLLCAGLLAFLPQFLFIHASVSNDPAITLTSTLTLTLLLWIARDGVTAGRAAALGAAIGLMAVSKLAGTVLAVWALLLLLGISRRPGMAAVSLGVAAAVSGGWYLRNQALYGDPLALGAFLNQVGASLAIPPLNLSYLWGILRYARYTTWGLFGQTSVLMRPTAIYNLLEVVALLGGAGLIVGAGGRLRRAVRGGGIRSGLRAFLREHQALVLPTLWAGASAAIALRWLLAAGLQGRLAFPGLPAGVILLIWGLHSLLPRFPDRTLAIGLLAPSLALAVAVIPAYLMPAYSPPALVSKIPDGMRPAGARFDEDIELRAYTLTRKGELLHLTFYWQALQTPPVDYTVAVRLVRPDGSFWLDYVNYPGMGTSLPTTWTPGEIREDEYLFDLERFPPATEPLRLIVGYFDPRTREMTPVTLWPDVREPGWATLTQIELERNQE